MKKVFFSFCYQRDNWRVQQIKNMGIVEGQKLCLSNEWEEVKRKGDNAIKKWIDENMVDKSCVIVLIGSETYGRKWVNYEIKKAWEYKKGLFGIYIHTMKDSKSQIDQQGKNPFESFTVNGKNLSQYIDVYYPNPCNAYEYIKINLKKWIEKAILKAKYR